MWSLGYSAAHDGEEKHQPYTENAKNSHNGVSRGGNSDVKVGYGVHRQTEMLSLTNAALISASRCTPYQKMVSQQVAEFGHF